MRNHVAQSRTPLLSPPLVRLPRESRILTDKLEDQSDRRLSELAREMIPPSCFDDARHRRNCWPVVEESTRLEPGLLDASAGVSGASSPRKDGSPGQSSVSG